MKRRAVARILAAIAAGAIAAAVAGELSPTKSYDVACPLFQVPVLTGGGGGGGDDCEDDFGGYLWGWG